MGQYLESNDDVVIVSNLGGGTDGGDIIFSTVPAGSTDPVERGRISSAGTGTGLLGGFEPSVAVNAKAQYGAKGDTQQVADAAMTASSTTLTSATASFTAADVGKRIDVGSAGAAAGVLRTTIRAYVSATQVTLAAAAVGTVSNQLIVWGTDDTTAIQNALNAAGAAAGVCYLPGGTYLVTSALTLPYKASLVGEGGGIFADSPSSTARHPILTTLFLAASSSCSMLVTDATGPVVSGSERWQRSRVIGICFDGHSNWQTGTAPCLVATNIWALTVQECTFIRTQGPAIKLDNCNTVRIADVDAVIDNAGGAPPQVFYLLDTADSIIEGCQVGGSAGPVLQMETSADHCWKNVVSHCLFFNAVAASGNEAGIYLKGATENIIQGCRVDQNYADGVIVDSNSSANVIDVVAVENGLGNVTGMAGVRVAGSNNRIDGSAAPGITGNQTLGVVIASNADGNIVSLVASGHTTNYSVSATGTTNTVVTSKTLLQTLLQGARLQLAQTGTGVITENFPPYLCLTSAAPSTQQAAGFLAGFRKGDVVNGIMLRLAVAASGTAPTKARVGIADSTGKMLAISNDLGAASNWPLGPAPMPLSAPYTILADGAYFLVFLVNGTWGTTQPTVGNLGAITLPLLGTAYGSNPPPSFRWNGQTDLPAVNSSLTLTSAAAVAYYIGAY